MTGYAVVDVETTGLLPDWHHRIAEIAIVHVDTDGAITDEWATLVNPRRDLGPQHVHRIRAADVRTAPTFADLAGDIADRLRGRVLVAHNLAFDALFLTAEYQRAGTGLALHGLCTMRLAQRYLDSPSRSLAACCRVAGIAQHAAHSALDDARAAAGLLARFVTAAGTPPPWAALLTDGTALPALPMCGRTTQRTSVDTSEPHFLARLVDRLPATSELPDLPTAAGPYAADDYLALLDRALVGRHLSATDQDALVSAATTLGLHRDDVLRLHRQYLAAVTTAAAHARADTSNASTGTPTGTEVAGTYAGTEAETAAADTTAAAERADLAMVAALLGLDPADAGTVDPPPATIDRFHLAPGDVVTFTGDMQDRREALHALATAAGLTVDDRFVTRRTRLLVAADPDTLSGKAATARRYGIPIITEAAFHTLLSTPRPTR